MSTELLRALRAVKWDVYSGEFKIARKDTGLCDAVIYVVRSGRVFGVARNVVGELKPLFVKWPTFSGHNAFPVPDPDCNDDDGTFEAREIFFAESEEDRMWAGEYGQLRLELLDFCIEQLELEL